MKVKPTRPGLLLRDPHTKRALPEEGGRVPDTSFWRRRIRSGEVAIMTDEEPTPPSEETDVDQLQ